MHGEPTPISLNHVAARALVHVARLLGRDHDESWLACPVLSPDGPAQNGHYEVVALLLEHGATVTQLTDEGFSPLYISAQNGHMDCVVLCLGASSMTKELADLGPKEIGGATALYIAVQNGHPDCVHQLIKAGVNVDPVTDAGSTPLMIALYLADVYGDKPHIDCARLLLEAGASLDIKDKSGRNALGWCGHDNSLIDMVVEEEKLRERQKKSGQRGFW